MKLYIVRHGETLFNAKNLVQGWCDSPLTEKGIHQADCTGYGLRDIPFVQAFCSTSERTLDTARHIIGDRKIPLAQRKELKEINFGTVEGDPMDEVFMKEVMFSEGFVRYGGETMEQSGIRAAGAWKRIAGEFTEGNVLIVTHGGVIMNGMEQLEPGIVERNMKLGRKADNCCVSVVDVTDGVLTVESFCSLEYRQKGEQYYAIS